MYNFPIKEMIYGERTIDILAGDDTTFEDFKYLIVNYGSHPVCYIGIPKVMAVNADEIPCHGGITWMGPSLPEYLDAYLADVDLERDTTWFIGWDYAHYMDRIYYSIQDYSGKSWTTEEMLDDCFTAIRYLESLRGVE